MLKKHGYVNEHKLTEKYEAESYDLGLIYLTYEVEKRKLRVGIF